MTPEDREFLQELRRQQADLRQALARLDRHLEALEARARSDAAPQAEVPPPPASVVDAHALPPVPASAGATLPPIPPPVRTHEAPLPPLPEAALPPVPRASLEFHFGRWLIRIGAAFGIVTLALILSLTHGWILARLGPAGLLILSGLACLGVFAVGERLERRAGPGLRLFARALAAMGLAGLYVTLYAAHSFPAVAVIASPLAAGVLLLFWSAGVLLVAQRKGSQALALFAVALAYFSTAINPVGRFTMAADLLLAGTVVGLLWRNGWTAVTWLGLLGTYFALLRRLVVDENGEFTLETTHTLPFAPYAVYLLGAWTIFTAGVLFSNAPSFRRGKRLALLSLNNGALAGLLVLTTYVAGYGHRAMGWALLWIGAGLVATAGFARARFATEDIATAYLVQGVAAFTAGLMGVCTGVTRGVLLAVETLFLGVPAGYSRELPLRIAAGLTALFATAFLLWEIGVNSHDPWRLGLGGAVVMLINAWWARREFGREAGRLVPGALYYCALALALIAAAMATKLSDSVLPPALGLVAVALTFSIYFLPLAELPALAQLLLVGAQALVLFPAETGEAMPRVSTACVAALTLILLAWWPRQRFLPRGSWVTALTFAYALALVGLAWHAVRPFVDGQDWMVSSSLLAFAFLAFGAVARIWPLAAMGQLFLLAALEYFFFPDGAPSPFPWTWSAAAVPIAVVFATGLAIHRWLRVFPEVPAPERGVWRGVAHAFQWLALAMLVRVIFALVPMADQIATFLFLGTFLVAWNARGRSRIGLCASFVPTVLGILLVFRAAQTDADGLATIPNALAILALLAQPALLRLGTGGTDWEPEGWILVVFSAFTGWVFVHAWTLARLHPNDITMGWALYALFLFLVGLMLRERRQRWCGLAILGAAIVRVLCCDIWALSNGYKVLTFVVLTLITLGLGFLYARFADRLKTWL